MVRVRFAPTPSGYLHLGGVGVAFYNWLFARQNNGKFILRIEDTDLNTIDEEFYHSIYEDLNWLGLEPDEGPQEGGPFAPYCQKERKEIYHKFAKILLDKGFAYKCFCNPKSEFKLIYTQGEWRRYSRYCKNLSNDILKQCELERRDYCIKFSMPSKRILVKDRIHGDLAIDTGLLGDFVIIKSNGLPTYNFACVVDDILMKITHIIRGREHLSNLPRQWLLYEALGAPPPEFIHIPLILDEERRKFSKSSHSLPVRELRLAGFVPQGIFFYLLHLGGFVRLKKIINRSELFSLPLCFRNKKRKGSPRFSWEELRQANRYVLHKFPLSELTPYLEEYLGRKGIINYKNKETLNKFYHLFDFYRKRFYTLAEFYSNISDLKDDINLGEFRLPLNILEDIKKNENKIINYIIFCQNKGRFPVYDFTINCLPQGFENESFEIILKNNQRFIFKRSLNPHSLYLYAEYTALKMLEPQNFTPKPFLLDLSKRFFKEPILIYYKLNGVPLSRLTLPILTKIAQKLSLIHSFTEEEWKDKYPFFPRIKERTPYATLEQTLYYLREYIFYRIAEGLPQDSKLIINIIKLVETLTHYLVESKVAKPSQFTLCHGDLRLHNILIDNEKIYFIDWERAGFGDPAWDIGWFFVYTNLTEAEEKVFWSAYESKLNKQELIERTNLYKLIHLVSWPIHILYYLCELKYGKLRASLNWEERYQSDLKEIIKRLKIASKTINKISPQSVSIEDKFIKKGELLLRPTLPPWKINDYIITIDGPAGAGKSPVGVYLASKLGYRFISSGCFYRLLAFLIKDLDIDYLKNLWKAVKCLATPNYPFIKIYLNKQDITSFLFTPETTSKAAQIATIPELRELVNLWIKELAQKGKVIVEGRDIGSVVLPQAHIKVFLTASLTERAKMKKGEFPGKSLKDIKKELLLRDRLDYTRTQAPLRIPHPALIINSTGMSIKEIACKIIGYTYRLFNE